MLSNDQFVPLHYSGVRGGKVNVEVEKHLQEFKNKESGDQGIVEQDEAQTNNKQDYKRFSQRPSEQVENGQLANPIFTNPPAPPPPVPPLPVSFAPLIYPTYPKQRKPEVETIISPSPPLLNCLSSNPDLQPPVCSTNTFFLSNPDLLVPASVEDRKTALSTPPFWSDCGTFAPSTLRWCEVHDVYLDGRDGISLPETMGALPPPVIDEAAKAPHNHKVSAAKLTPTEEFLNNERSFFFLKGHTSIVCCWRQQQFNPSHVMYALGSIFSLFATYPPEKPPIDNILLHQCVNPFQNAFGRAVMRMVWQYGISNGKVTDTTNFAVVPYLHERNSKSNSPFYIIDKGFVSRFTGKLVGMEAPYVVDEFKNAWPPPQGAARGSCSDGLHIHIFQRADGSALRKFVNLEEVKKLAKEFSPNVKVVTTSGKMDFEEQRKIFNSFDILLTPHGSHLTNSIFIQNNNTSIIECQSSCFHRFITDSFSDYVISTGHQPEKESNREIARRCNERQGDACQLSKFCNQNKAQMLLQDNLIIDIEILREEFRRSVKKICPP